MAVWLIALAATSLASANPKFHRCDLGHLQTCRNTNELVCNRAFQNAVRDFLGNRKAAFLYKRSLVSQQAIAVLGGPPDAPSKLGKMIRFTACRAHSCDEKGVTVLSQKGEVQAIGILHAACAGPQKPENCFTHVTMSVFVRANADRKLIIDDLTGWARQMVAGSYTYPGLVAEKLDAVDVTPVSPTR